jgi:hypothetical protein
MRHPASSIQYRVGGRVGERAHRARGGQFAQEKPLEQLEGVEQATSGDPEVLAKLETWRSTFSPSHLGHFTPSAPAPIFCRREKLTPQSLHRYS